MTLHLPQGYAQVIHSFLVTGDPEPMAVTYAVEADPATSPFTDANALATAAQTFLFTDMQGKMNPAVEHRQTEVRWQTLAPPADPVLGVDTTTWSGTNGGAGIVPQNTAWLVHKRTGLAGRKGRGRMFFPGVDEASVDNVGVVSSSVVAAWNTALEAWRQEWLGTTPPTPMVLLHTDPALTPSVVGALQLDSRVATQRRRLRK